MALMLEFQRPCPCLSLIHFLPGKIPCTPTLHGLPTHQTHPCACPVFVCSPDIADEGEYRCSAQQKQQPPVGKAVGKSCQENDSHGEKAVSQDEGVRPVHAH